MVIFEVGFGGQCPPYRYFSTKTQRRSRHKLDRIDRIYFIVKLSKAIIGEQKQPWEES
jgi:hypothetical protein